jgi:hypothetical protein
MTSDSDLASGKSGQLFKKVRKFLGIGMRDRGGPNAATEKLPSLEDSRSRPNAIDVETAIGKLELFPATEDEIKSVAALWPMGVVIAGDDAPNLLNFQVGEEEAYGLKMQPPDTDERTAIHLYFQNLIVIATALPAYLEHKHRGVVLPCVYLKKKSDDRFESGIAFFVGPDPASHTPELKEVEVQHDKALGEGASKMILDFVHSIMKASEKIKMPLGPFIGFDVRPRLALGILGMPFLVRGGQVFAIQYPLHPERPFWEYVVRAGFAKLPYAPMILGAVPGPPNVPHSWKERVGLLTQRLRDLERQ